MSAGHPRLVEEGGWGEQVQQEWPGKTSRPSVEDVAHDGWDLSARDLGTVDIKFGNGWNQVGNGHQTEQEIKQLK